MSDLFSLTKQQEFSTWNDVRTHLVRTQYNELLAQVLDKDNSFIVNRIPNTKGEYRTLDGKVPQNYYNPNLCFALVRRDCTIIEIARRGVAEDNKAEAAKKSKTNEKSLASQPEAFNQLQSLCYEDVNYNLDRLPAFLYDRFVKSIPVNTPPLPPSTINSTLELDTKLNFGTVLWLYNYDRMGIFDILKVLMNDYNYIGKLPISAKSENTTSENTLRYSELMDTISTLYRLGIGSNTLDRKSLYQRVLGVTIPTDNGSNLTSEKNENFMKNFNKVVGLMIDFYRDKQLAQAIRDTSSNTIRSSVATQTAIRDTILVLQKNFEVFDYGRNRINTFLSIATVYATICLVRMLKDEIGVPRQYDQPHEFISAAYDILVAKRPVTSSEVNRFTIYDNCASYGYRLLTDIELIEPAELTTVAIGSTLDAWLNDIEGVVEGYNNAYKSVGELSSTKQLEMVS